MSPLCHPNTKHILIGYVPSRSSGWILEYLFKDLAKASSSNSVQYRFATSIAGILTNIRGQKSWKILCMHASFAKRLLLVGFPPSRICIYYTHTRLAAKINPRILRTVSHVFCQNSVEAGILLSEGILPSKLTVFPLGFCHQLFCFSPPSSNYDIQPLRPIDILFVGRYVSSTYYNRRKNIAFMSLLVRQLLFIRPTLNITFLGSGWSNNPDLSHLPVRFEDVPFSKYPSIYQQAKLYINVSRQEGGPISWLEAMASGCFLLSSPSGFALELPDGTYKSWVHTLSGDEFDWTSRALHILDSYVPLNPSELKQRSNYLSRSEFRFLSETLELTLFSPQH